MISLLDLPAEVVLEILSRLRPKDLFVVASVCNALRRLASDDSLWKFPLAAFSIYDSHSTKTESGKSYKQRYLERAALEGKWNTKPRKKESFKVAFCTSFAMTQSEVVICNKDQVKFIDLETFKILDTHKECVPSSKRFTSSMDANGDFLITSMFQNTTILRTRATPTSKGRKFLLQKVYSTPYGGEATHISTSCSLALARTRGGGITMFSLDAENDRVVKHERELIPAHSNMEYEEWWDFRALGPTETTTGGGLVVATASDDWLVVFDIETTKSIFEASGCQSSPHLVTAYSDISSRGGGLNGIYVMPGQSHFIMTEDSFGELLSWDTRLPPSTALIYSRVLRDCQCAFRYAVLGRRMASGSLALSEVAIWRADSGLGSFPLLFPPTPKQVLVERGTIQAIKMNASVLATLVDIEDQSELVLRSFK